MAVSAFERRQQINECFEPSAPTGEKQPHKLYEDFRAALEREIQRLGKKCKDNGKPSETSAVKPRMNSKDSEDRVRLGSLLSRGGSSRSECGSDAHQAVFDAEVREVVIQAANEEAERQVVIQAANEEAERQAEINRLRYGSATEMPDPLTRHKSRRDVAGKQEEAAGDEEDKDTFASEQLFQPSFRKPQRKDRRVHSANDLGQWLKDQRETTVAGPSGTHSEREAGAGDADSGGREGRKA
ncbi:hypothetical protein T484DRAFT_1855890 [Baffinella frigidus]|nr:hypothetical protein T484DRAFT_1855890 [Cryptophyta sp. CCMP2293]